MFEDILLAIKELVEEIYTVDQNDVDKKFIAFLDELNKLLTKLEAAGFQVDMTEEMLTIQKCYEKRDLIELTDYLLYEFKESIAELQNIVAIQD